MAINESMKREADSVDPNPILEHIDQLPPVLYKYKSFSDFNHCLTLARDGSVFFADARNLNDPFECRFVPRSPALTLEGNELRNYLLGRIEVLEPTARGKEIDDLLSTAMDNVEQLKSGNPDAMTDVMENQYGAMGILSLSQSSKSLPMWAYYGDSHKGICVGLKTRSLGEFQARLLKQSDVLVLRQVIYEENMPVVSMESSDRDPDEAELDQAEQPYYTKAQGWVHEQEYRALLWNNVNTAFTLGSKSVAEVIFGSRACKAHVKAIVDELRNSGSEATISMARASFSKYEIILERI